MRKHHKLLERQIRRHLKLGLEAGPEGLRELEEFLAAVDQAYRDFDSDRDLIERAQELSSKELLEEKLTAETKARELAAATAELYATQAKLLTAAKMSALGEMAGGVAHEINTPLSVIKMRIELMEESVQEGEPDLAQMSESIEVVKKTVDRIAKIVSGLRFFAREGRSGPMELARVSAIVNDTLSLCSERFASHGVEIEINGLAVLSEAECECRPVEISQVLLNLLNNAYDAIEKDKEKWIRIDILDPGDSIDIAVTDSGHGIPDFVREKMMQPFFTTKEIGKGTGLGLSLSKGIMEEHGGRLYFDNEAANTRFVLSLPKRQSSAARSEAA